MTLEEYIGINYPGIVAEYNRYENRHEFPTIGENVITLRIGFGGDVGRILTVSEIDEEYITLTDGDNNYISAKETWYKDIEREIHCGQ